MPSRILVLHGYEQSAFHAYRKLSPIIAECRNHVEFYFLDAPMIMVPADPKAHFGNLTDARYMLKSVPTCSTPTMHPHNSGARRAWFKINQTGRDSLPGIEETWRYLRDVLKTHRFDAIFGFSQGAAMAGQIAAMLERPSLFPMFCEDGIAPHPPLKFIVSISGFLIRGPKLSWESGSESPIPIAAPSCGFTMDTPVLYVVGQNDIVVPPERSHIFIEHSRFKRVEHHHGGHFIPLQPKWRQFLVSFLLDPFGEIPSPSIVTTAVDDVEPYPIGQTLPCSNPETFFYSVVYDSGSDCESDDQPSPPDTPYLRTPQLPVLELDEPAVVDSGLVDAISGFIPVSGHDAERSKSKL
ncbi:serine hydrolase-domain-containing protein [Rhodocollybia butyracea]|uniref:Serine hydrolase-domain-containing protein n=1 Tax=Rhodocollybia butyracea TaxID=206335 RepID=A0A9P5U2V1_9AGAR|nr:serine hydrolase-domain-containing protein [Rhodocollybia butyracea]